MLHHDGENVCDLRMFDRQSCEQDRCHDGSPERRSHRAGDLDGCRCLTELLQPGRALHDDLDHAHHRAHEQADRDQESDQRCRCDLIDTKAEENNGSRMEGKIVVYRVLVTSRPVMSDPAPMPTVIGISNRPVSPGGCPRTTSRYTGRNVMSDTSAAP